MPNSNVVKQSFALLTPDGAAATEAMEYFYARLFTLSPSARSLFPTTMTTQRDRMFAALSRLIDSLDSESDRAVLLTRFARDHRRFGVLDKHYGAFFTALRDTLSHCLGSAWTTETAQAWQSALGYLTVTMRTAARQVDVPAWWTAEIVSHELRSPGVAVVGLRTDQPLPYQAGQYVSVQVTKWPRNWRPYSVATAPRPGRLLELHVRAVPGGLVSNALVHHSDIGDPVLLGPADGAMTLAESDLDLLCVAGGTGLAPIKAIIEQAIAADKTSSRPRTITLFVGARQEFDLYDLPDLQLLEAAWPALHVIPVLSEQPSYAGLTGLLPEVLADHGPFADTEAYVCGPPEMVSQAAAQLAASMPASQIHADPPPEQSGAAPSDW